MKFTWNPTIHDIALRVWRVLHAVGREPSLENVWTCLDHEGNMLRTNKIKMRKLNRSIGP